VKFIPAIDLKNNQCVRLQKGKENLSTVFNKNPIEQAKYFEKNGCERIHIVDLDAAFGKSGINIETIVEIRKKINIELELGGGIRSQEDIVFWMNQGIDFLILGSLAVSNKNLVADVSKKFKNKVYIALDILKNRIMINGWLENSNILADEIIHHYSQLPINGFILTDISRDGMLEGIDIDLVKNYIFKTNKNIIVGGGLSNYKDLSNLKKVLSTNLEGVIAGKSFYSGNIEIKKALDILKKDA
tara:strand:+ start:175 stop:906 length:732 start_codon:yes stop_codon:yes gene_type:complete